MPVYSIFGVDVWIPGIEDLTAWVVTPINNFLRAAWSLGGELYNAIRNTVTQGLQAFFTLGGSFFNTLQSTVTTALQNVGGAVWDSILKTGQDIFNRVQSFASDIWNFLKPGWDSLQATLGGIPKAVVDGLNTATAAISGFIGSISQNVLTWIGEVEFTFINEVKFWVGEAAEYIINSLKQGVNQAGGAIGQVVAGLQSLGQDISSALASTQSAIEAHLTWTANENRANLAWFAQSTQDALTGIWDGFFGSVIQPIQQAVVSFFSMLPSQIQAAFSGSNPLWQGVTNAFNAIWQFLTETLIKSIQPSPAEWVTDPVKGVVRVVTGTLGLAGSIALPMMLGELIQPLKNMGMARLAAYVYEAADFKAVGGDVIKTLIKASSIEPMQRGLNLIYRNTLPNLSLVDDMNFKGLISGQQWAASYALQGWSDENIQAWDQARYRDPSQRALLDMFEVPGIPEDWIIAKLKGAGISDADLPFWLLYRTRKLIRDELGRIFSAAEAAYVKGYYSQEGLRDVYALGGVSQLEADWKIASAQIRENIARMDEGVDIVVQAFRAGNLDQAEFEAAVSALPLTPARQQNIIERELARRRQAQKAAQAEKRKKLSVAEILRGFDYELFTEAEALDRLQLLEYTPDDAQLIVQIHKAQQAAREATADERAALTAERAEARQEQSLATAYARYLIRAMQARLISLDVVRSEIQGLPLAQGRKELLIREAELAQATEAPITSADVPVQLREAEVYKAWDLGIIGEALVRTYLQALEFTAEEIELKILINRPK